MEDFDLTKEEDKNKILEQVSSFRGMHAPDLVSKLLRQLKEKLTQSGDEELVKEYEDIILDLEWIGLTVASEVVLKRLVEKHLARVLDWEDYGLIEKFDYYIKPRVPFLLRDRFKKEVMSILRQNKEEITNKEIEDNQGKMVTGTIANWLKEYDLLIGSGLADKLRKTEFIYQTKNARDLTETERVRLVKLIDFYEHLKVSSEHPTGVEEKFIIQDEDRLVEIDHGKVVELCALPEVQEREEKGKEFVVRHPHIEDFLDEEDKEKETHLTAVSKEGKHKFIKPALASVSASPAVVKKAVMNKPPVVKPKVVAPSLKEAEIKMKKKEKIIKSKPKVKNPEPINIPESIPMPKPKPKIIPPKPMSPIQSKPIITDVKAPQRVLSLTDELEQMSTDEFRNLGADKIREKMGLLENESIEKKSGGIQAWKKSPVNLLYLEIGQDSVTQGKGVREVIKSREESGQLTLTYAEFEDLADLNRSLRF